MAKCNACDGGGKTWRMIGPTNIAFQCPACNGSGQQPDAPAPACDTFTCENCGELPLNQYGGQTADDVPMCKDCAQAAAESIICPNCRGKQWTPEICPVCHGEAPAPDALAPTELARRLLLWIDDGIPLGYRATARGAAAMLTRQAAVVEAAREFKAACDERGVTEWLEALDEADAEFDDDFDPDDDPEDEWPSAPYTTAKAKLEAALAATEATDGD